MQGSTEKHAEQLSFIVTDELEGKNPPGIHRAAAIRSIFLSAIENLGQFHFLDKSADDITFRLREDFDMVSGTTKLALVVTRDE